MSSTVLDVGDRARIYTSEPFTDAATSTAVDPATVTLTVQKPDGTQLVYGYPVAGADGTLDHDAPDTGLYETTVDVDQEGPWLYRWSSTGPAQAAEEGRFFVRRRSVAVA